MIGKVGFGKCFGALESLDHPAEGDAFNVVATGISPYSAVTAVQHVFQTQARFR